jgi:hypothetical protein
MIHAVNALSQHAWMSACDGCEEPPHAATANATTIETTKLTCRLMASRPPLAFFVDRCGKYLRIGRALPQNAAKRPNTPGERASTEPIDVGDR